ncbi:cation/H(+) antiporter 4-like [Gastrolobium bilobum]|uniref:cation/H(+) antiporter 4-like n=1 Tax=Gastrolobium bilobum TaxID=150636 RepID=UPI002AAF377B|nr:cation/H(+) antiporter 4-like [Gastrolobium bilobum]
MNYNANETLFKTITKINETWYNVCYDAPPHTVSDGLWGGKENGRTPMKSFLPMFELQVLIIFALTQIFRLLLKPLVLPQFISQMMAGLILAASLQLEPLDTYTKVLFPYGTHDVISTISSIGYVLFIFINGVQMDFSMITRTGNKAWSISLIGLFVPLLVGLAPLLLFFDAYKKIDKHREIFLAFASHTTVSFPVIASLLNELQIQNSELGRLSLSSALVSDILSSTLANIGHAIVVSADRKVLSTSLISYVAFIILIPALFRPAMFWIIKHTPEGRPVKDGYIYLIIVMVFGLGWVSVKINQDFVLGAFVLGLSVPEGPPLGSALVKKLEFFGTWFFLPIFVTTCVLKADFSMHYSPVVFTIIVVVICAHILKIIACFLPALCCNMPATDALSLALILNAKGVVEVGTYCALYDAKFMDGQVYGMMMISVMFVASIVQCSVKVLYDPTRKYAGYQKRNIMSLKPNSELRMLVCIHKPNNISSMIDVLDLSCPTTEYPITVDALHLIELVGRAVPIFIPHRLQRQESGSHKSYSDDIILAFDIYEHDNPEAVTAYAYTAISPPNLMYEDVCHLALDKVTSMIILPFHQRRSIDGGVESDDKNIRALNCKVLEVAPCSVGILVSRASHSIRDTTTRLAVIYLGGKDDQEVLCIAKRAIRNPRINLDVYHLVCVAELEDLLDDNEMLEDVKHSPNVRYQEITAKDGAETAAFLRDIVNEHDFFIVGRRHGIHSPQTDGLTNWSEFPELGVVGDFLASPDFETRASVLVVQQQLLPTKRSVWIFN